jgi:hypothetical protein
MRKSSAWDASPALLAVAAHVAQRLCRGGERLGPACVVRALFRTPPSVCETTSQRSYGVNPAVSLTISLMLPQLLRQHPYRYFRPHRVVIFNSTSVPEFVVTLVEACQHPNQQRDVVGPAIVTYALSLWMEQSQLSASVSCVRLPGRLLL